MTQNEFQMLMARLDKIEKNQADLRQLLEKQAGTDGAMAERIARLEANQQRYVTFKHLVIAAGTAACAGGGIGLVLKLLIGE